MIKSAEKYEYPIGGQYNETVALLADGTSVGACDNHREGEVMGEKFYKVLKADGSTYHANSFKWKLPRGNRPGAWMPKVKIEICKSGYHITTHEGLLDWLGEAIYEVEWRGEILHASNKVAVTQARLVRKLNTWNDRTARLFACDCAMRVLIHFEKYHPKDKRPRKTIQIARRYAEGEATQKELTAARAAAVAAAVDAARAAAVDAARAAARAAAVDAAWIAAWSAEQRWQIKRLWLYLDGALPKK